MMSAWMTQMMLTLREGRAQMVFDPNVSVLLDLPSVVMDAMMGYVPNLPKRIEDDRMGLNELKSPRMLPNRKMGDAVR